MGNRQGATRSGDLPELAARGRVWLENYAEYLDHRALFRGDGAERVYGAIASATRAALPSVTATQRRANDYIDAPRRVRTRAHYTSIGAPELALPPNGFVSISFPQCSRPLLIVIYF